VLVQTKREIHCENSDGHQGASIDTRDDCRDIEHARSRLHRQRNNQRANNQDGINHDLQNGSPMKIMTGNLDHFFPAMPEFRTQKYGSKITYIWQFMKQNVQTIAAP
jgi:hypothetical protein